MSIFLPAFQDYVSKVSPYLWHHDPYDVKRLLHLYREHMMKDSRNKTEATKIQRAIHDAFDATLEEYYPDDHHRVSMRLKIYEQKMLQAQNDQINARHANHYKSKITRQEVVEIEESDDEDEYESDFIDDEDDEDEEDPEADYEPFECV